MIRAADVQFHTAVQHDCVVAVEHRMKSLDAIDVDDDRAMDSDKLSRVQLLFQLVKPFADQVDIFALRVLKRKCG